LLAKLLEKLQEIDLNYNDRLYLVPENPLICSAHQNNVDFFSYIIEADMIFTFKKSGYDFSKRLI
jgi:hypothetical protein